MLVAFDHFISKGVNSYVEAGKLPYFINIRFRYPDKCLDPAYIQNDGDRVLDIQVKTFFHVGMIDDSGHRGFNAASFKFEFCVFQLGAEFINSRQISVKSGLCYQLLFKEVFGTGKVFLREIIFRPYRGEIVFIIS